jgi:hypothetical protein
LTATAFTPRRVLIRRSCSRSRGHAQAMDRSITARPGGEGPVQSRLSTGQLTRGAEGLAARRG